MGGKPKETNPKQKRPKQTLEGDVAGITNQRDRQATEAKQKHRTTGSRSSFCDVSIARTGFTYCYIPGML